MEIPGPVRSGEQMYVPGCESYREQIGRVLLELSLQEANWSGNEKAQYRNNDISLCSSAVLTLSLTSPHLLPLPVLSLYVRISPVRRRQHFMTASCTQKVLVSGGSTATSLTERRGLGISDIGVRLPVHP